jgi:hypothetical protein
MTLQDLHGAPEGAAFVPLTRGVRALVDLCDLPLVNEHKWHATSNGFSRPIYAVRVVPLPCGGVQRIYMHNVILQPPPGLFSDHINLDTVDNRRQNLRVATKAQNLHNRRAYKNSTHGFKGVKYDRTASPNRRYAAFIACDGRRYYLGRYGTPEEAHAAYWEAAQRLHGEFARAS